jgi:hypothetical protein
LHDFAASDILTVKSLLWSFLWSAHKFT